MSSTISALTSGGGLAMAGDTSGSLQLQTNNGTTAVTIDTSQNVGIGTASPAAKIDILGSTGATNRSLKIKPTTNSADIPNLRTVVIENASNDTTLALGYTASPDALTISATYGTTGAYKPLVFATSDTERMRIDSSGNLLVGGTLNTASAGIVCNSANGISIERSGAGYRQMYMSGGVLYFYNGTNQASLSSAGAWTNASDARLKNSITDIKYGLDTVLNTKPRSYKMNDLEGDYIGFVAQELQTVIPEVISGEPEKQLGVDYGSLVAVAFKAIQELNAKVEAQAAEIKALKGVA